MGLVQGFTGTIVPPSGLSMLRLLAAPLVLALSGACATPGPASPGIVWYQGEPFLHPVVFNAAFRARRAGVHDGIHVYLGGDGRPWLSRNRIAYDPTPSRELAIDLLDADPYPAVFIGRPCTFGAAARDPACTPLVWTAGRYGEPVIASAASVIEQIAEPRQPITLLGYSGGAVLATWLAARLPSVAALVTVAGDLDVTAWTRHHHYTPLFASRDSADAFPLPATLPQAHLFGQRDVNCPAQLAEGALRKDPHATVYVVREMRHECCWEKIWPSIAAAIGRDGSGTGELGDALERLDLILPVGDRKAELSSDERAFEEAQ